MAHSRKLRAKKQCICIMCWSSKTRRLCSCYRAGGRRWTTLTLLSSPALLSMRAGFRGLRFSETGLPEDGRSRKPAPYRVGASRSSGKEMSTNQRVVSATKEVFSVAAALRGRFVEGVLAGKEEETPDFLVEEVTVV